MPRFAILEAPSPLGVGPTGVEQLPSALLRAGLLDGLSATHAGRVEPPPYDPLRDPETRILNLNGVRALRLPTSRPRRRLARPRLVPGGPRW